MAKKYRVAVIGHTGRGDYGHGLHVVWNDIANVEVVAVADPVEKGRADAAKKTNAKAAYADYRKMLEKEKPQIVSVATRHLDQHRDMVIACANAGASVFLEKPMCRTLAEADEMVKACEMKHVKLAIAFQTRYSPRLARVKEMLADKLGDLLELRGRGKEDRRGGGEDLMVLGSHIVDLMRFLAGDAAWCFARAMHGGEAAAKAHIRKDGPEGMGPILGDHINAVYGLPKGALGTFGTHRARDGANQRFALSVHGSKGIVQLHTGSLPAVWYCDDPSWMPGQSKKAWRAVSSAGLGKPEPLKGGAGAALGNVLIVKDLIEAIEKDRQPLGSVYDARAALEMVLAVYASHAAGGPVALPLKERRHPLAAW